jgi:hypothetical protein
MNNATPDPDSDWQEQMDAEWRKEAANRAALLESLIHQKDWVACRRWINQWQAEASAEVLTRPGADLLPPTDKTNRLGDLTIMTHPIGYYTSYSPGRDAGTLLDQLQQRYGAQLQGMHRLSKMAFRAALANYITQQVAWKDNPSEAMDMADALESAWAEIWEHDEEAAQYILKSSSLSQSDLEGLIEAISAQIRDKV